MLIFRRMGEGRRVRGAMNQREWLQEIWQWLILRLFHSFLNQSRKPALSHGRIVLKSATVLSLEIRREPREPPTAQNSKSTKSTYGWGTGGGGT